MFFGLENPTFLAKLHIFIPKYTKGGSTGLGIIPKNCQFFSASLMAILVYWLLGFLWYGYKVRCLGRSKQFVWSMQGIKRAMKPSRSRYVASLGQRWRWMAGSAKVTDKQPGSELLPPTTPAIRTDTHSFRNTCNVVCPVWGRPFTESIDWYQNHHLNHSFSSEESF